MTDPIVDADNPEVAALADALRRVGGADVSFSAVAYEYVRDEIAHSVDVRDRRVTLSASDTLRHGVGLCFSKAHLLAAVLRAQGVPAGLCYQRLIDDVGGFVVHGLIAVYLEDAWRRLDPRRQQARYRRTVLARERTARMARKT